MILTKRFLRANILSHLQYCLINWGNFKGDRNLGLRDRILALQKRLVRIICGTHRISHADPLFAQLGALKIDDLYTQSVRIISFKASGNQLPGGMSRFFDRVSHRYNTRGARSNLFVNRSDCSRDSCFGCAERYHQIDPLDMSEGPQIKVLHQFWIIPIKKIPDWPKNHLSQGILANVERFKYGSELLANCNIQK